MFMKHYAPNRCEPSIEALNFRGGGGDQDVNREVKFCENSKKKKNIYIFFFFWGVVMNEGGGGSRGTKN